MLDQIQETQETQDKPRNIRKLNPYPRQEQVINPKNLGNPGNTQVIYFLGKPNPNPRNKLPGYYLGFLGFTQVISFLGKPKKTQENPGNTQVIYFLGWGGLPKKEITWVLPGLPKYLGLITCSCLGYGFRLE